jgi:Family of unknown function (DUF6267)
MAGIAHPEDLIINEGSKGAHRAVNELTNLSTLTIKWDGFPAIVFGRDKNGNLVIVDKHMFKQVAKGNLEFTSIRDYDLTRNIDRNDLWAKEDILRPALDKIIPNITDTYYMGDLLWVNTPASIGDSFVFKPNTVEYRVKHNSELGNSIANSIGGIAVHTFIPGLTAEDEPVTSIDVFSECKDITFISTKMKQTPNVAINSALLQAVQTALATYSSDVDATIAKLTELKCKSVITAMSPFITSMINNEDLSTNITSRFIEFSTPRLTNSARTKLFLPNGKLRKDIYRGILGLWEIWGAISNLKLDIKHQIDAQQLYSAVQPVINSIISHEGYVCGAGVNKIKIVNRLEFSRANFSKYSISAEEIETKSKMPMATFCFGRMNPPTVGHKKVIQQTVELGKEHAYIFASNKHDPNSDPLEYEVKTEFIKKIHPDYSNFMVTEYVRDPWQAVCWLYDRGYRHMTFVAGSDRLGPGNRSLETALNNWNSGPSRTVDYARGPNGREHVVLKFVSSGDRTEETNNASGTLAREYAKTGDKINFQLVTGVSEDITVFGKTLYEATREGMNCTME